MQKKSRKILTFSIRHYFSTQFYTSDEVAALTPYKTGRTLLQAIANNKRALNKLLKTKTNRDNIYEKTEKFNELYYNTLNKISDTEVKNMKRSIIGKERWFSKNGIDLILGGKIWVS